MQLPEGVEVAEKENGQGFQYSPKTCFIMKLQETQKKLQYGETGR